MPRFLFSDARWASEVRVSGSRRKRREGFGAVLHVEKRCVTCVRSRGREGSALAAWNEIENKEEMESRRWENCDYDQRLQHPGRVRRFVQFSRMYR